MSKLHFLKMEHTHTLHFIFLFIRNRPGVLFLQLFNPETLAPAQQIFGDIIQSLFLQSWANKCEFSHPLILVLRRLEMEPLHSPHSLSICCCYCSVDDDEDDDDEDADNGDAVDYNEDKQDAAHEPECSHMKHSCETSYLNSLVHFSPVTVPVHCRHVEGGGVQSVECDENGVLSGECSV